MNHWSMKVHLAIQASWIETSCQLALQISGENTHIHENAIMIPFLSASATSNLVSGNETHQAPHGQTSPDMPT